jgi:hypothetical protein
LESSFENDSTKTTGIFRDVFFLLNCRRRVFEALVQHGAARGAVAAAAADAVDAKGEDDQENESHERVEAGGAIAVAGLGGWKVKADREG